MLPSRRMKKPPSWWLGLTIPPTSNCSLRRAELPPVRTSYSLKKLAVWTSITLSDRLSHLSSSICSLVGPRSSSRPIDWLLFQSILWRPGRQRIFVSGGPTKSNEVFQFSTGSPRSRSGGNRIGWKNVRFASSRRPKWHWYRSRSEPSVRRDRGVLPTIFGHLSGSNVWKSSVCDISNQDREFLLSALSEQKRVSLSTKELKAFAKLTLPTSVQTKLNQREDFYTKSKPELLTILSVHAVRSALGLRP